ncbi:MAG: hypothetical protein H7067_07610 [Burkholderiales bacterium]|nr:hypothetical protein [Opitutaceae bacterium]
MSLALSLLTPDQVRTFSSYTDGAKAQIERRLAILAPVLALQKGHCSALAVIARREGLSRPTLLRWYYAARRGDLHALCDKSRDSKLWVRTKGTPLMPSADIATWHSYALTYQRKGGLAAAHRELIRDWRAGKVSTTQPLDALRGHPEGWSLANLTRLAPDDYELASTRTGRFAASDHRPQVLTTRKGLRVAQYFVGDDVWHDHLVSWRGQRTPVRPLEASVLDLASATLCQWGLRPRLVRADGTRENLKEREVRWIVAATHRNVGYRADALGTTWLVESGTFALRDAVARPLFDAFGIKVESSSIMSDKAWLGAYGARGGGNPRFKTWLESIHNLRHNEMSGLPGQTGRNRDEKPEEHAGLVRYAERVADMEERIALAAPHLAAQIARPVLSYDQFYELCQRVYGFINARQDHALEGWRESGHEVIQYLLGQTLLDEEQFLALPPPAPGLDMRAWAQSLALAGHTRTRLRRPCEVLAAGRRELSILPTHGVSLILGADLGREQKVSAGEFLWEDAELGPGEWRYFAEITTPEGRRELLRNGESYLVHANPFAPEELSVSDAKGRFLGVALRHARANRADREEMQAQYKQIAETEARLQDELAKKTEPMLRARMAGMQANAATMREALHTPEASRAKATAKRDRDYAAEAEAALDARHYHPADTTADA